MNNTVRKTLSVILALVLLLPAFPVVPAAAAPEFFEREGDSATYDGMTRVANYQDGDFYAFAGTEVKAENGVLKAGAEGAGSFYGVFENTLDLSRFNEITFSFRAEAKTPGAVNFGVTLSAGGETYGASGLFSTGVTHEVTLPVADFGERGSVDHVYFTFDGADAVTVEPLYGDEKFTYSHLERFSADTFTSDCDIRLEEDAVYLSPSDGAGYIEAPAAVATEVKASAVIRVRVSGVEGGTMILSLGDSSGVFNDISAVALFSGTNTYTFIDESGYGASSYRISFAGVGGAEEIKISGVTFTYYDEKINTPRGDLPGNVSSCVLSSDGRTVRIRGTLSSSFVLANMGTKISVFATDMWESEEARRVTDADISTVFDLSFPVSDLPMPAGFYKYHVALSDGEEALTAPLYPTPPSQNARAASSILGVEAKDTSVPFDSEASFAAVEANLDRLISDDAAGARFHSFAGGYYYFNVDAVEELDRTVGFYISSGVNVLLRIVMDGDGALYSLPDCEKRDEVFRYAAAVDYLTERYPGVYSIIVGRKINSFVYNEMKESDLFLYAENYVKLLRVTSSVAKVNSPATSVALPIGDGYVYKDAPEGASSAYDDMTGVGEGGCDPMLLSVLVSKYVAAEGALPWALVYECESDPAGSAELLSRAASRLVQNVGSSPSGQIVYWRPEHAIDDGELERLSAKMTESSSSLGTRALIVSLAEQSGDESYIAGALTELTFESTPVRRTAYYKAVKLGSSPAGQVFIKDFRRSWGVGGFTAGGDVTSLTTESSPSHGRIEGTDGCRALRALSGGGRSLIVSLLDEAKDLSGVDALNAVVSVTGEAEEYGVRIIVGNDELRAVYEFTAGDAAICSCPLTDELKDASYVAIEVDGEGAYRFELSSVSLSRRDGDSSKITGDADKAQDERPVTVVAVIAGASVLTLLVFALVTATQNSRKKRGK